MQTIFPDRLNRHRPDVYSVLQFPLVTQTASVLSHSAHGSFRFHFNPSAFDFEKKSGTLDSESDCRRQSFGRCVYLRPKPTFTGCFQLQTSIAWSVLSVIAAVVIQQKIVGAQKASTITRKVFHLLAIPVYVPGLLYHCSFLYLASGVVLGIFIVLEVRLRKSLTSITSNFS